MHSIEYRCVEGIPDDENLNALVEINQAIFGFDETVEHFRALFGLRRQILVCLACDHGRPVGYKVGFRERGRYFESWRGGVLPSHRNRGIAQQLMTLQHAWCVDNGFWYINTVTDNHNTQMMMLNLRAGFLVNGFFLDRGEYPKVLWQKCLRPSSPA